MSSVLPAAATYSKSPQFWGRDFQPAELKAGLGAYVLGTDGQRYLDWTSSLGAVLLGHNDRAFTERLYLQLLDGIAFTLPHCLEAQVAKKLCEMLGAHVPGWSADDLQVRWTLGGSESCEGAVTLARAATQRDIILSIGYHGWHAMFTGLTPPAHGIVRDDTIFAVPFGDMATLNALLISFPVAAVIIEQLPQEPPNDYWQTVRQWCDDLGTLLILDEVVSGFRFSCGGAAELYGVRPDIAVYGKAIANGVPLGAIVAPREYMRLFEPPSPVFVSATGAGNALGLAAVDHVLSVWNQAGVDHLRDIGTQLANGLTGMGYSVQGQPARFIVQHETNAHRGYVIKGMAERGILFNRPVIANLAHTEDDVAKTLAAAWEIKREMASVDVQEVMRGKEPMQLFEER